MGLPPCFSPTLRVSLCALVVTFSHVASSASLQPQANPTYAHGLSDQTSQYAPVKLVHDAQISPNAQVVVAKESLSSLMSKATQIGDLHVVTQWQEFIAPVRFDRLMKEIYGLRHLLDNIDPSGTEEFTELKGRFHSFSISNRAAVPGLNLLKCAERNAELISLTTYSKEDLSADRDVLLLDTITPANNSVSCFLHDSNVRGILCVKLLTNWAHTAGLIFPYSDNEDAIKSWTQMANHKTLHLVVNSTHMTLQDNPLAAAICTKGATPSGQPEFAQIMRSKYFAALGNFCNSVLDATLKRVRHLQNTFVSLMDNQLQSHSDPASICEFLRTQQFSHCVGHGLEQNTSFALAFSRHKPTLLAVSTALQYTTDLVKQACNRNPLQQKQFLEHAYNALVSIRIEMTGAFRSYGKTVSPSAAYSVLPSLTTTSVDMMACLNQAANTRLTHLEASQLYGWIADALSQWSEQSLTTSVTYRAKRWVYTKPLAYLTGLTDSDTVAKDERNIAKILAGEKENAQELVHLEEKEIVMISALKEQDSRMQKLFSDENEISNLLERLTKEEVTITEKLGHIVTALEVSDDVGLEFSSLLATLALLPRMVDNVESQLRSLLTSQVEPNTFPSHYRLHPALLASSSISPFISAATGPAVSIRVPATTEQFAVMSISSLPIRLLDGTTYALDLEHTCVAVNDQRETILGRDLCAHTTRPIVVETNAVTIHRVATTCAESLATSPGFPEICKTSLQIVANARQQHMFLNATQIALFSPYEDSASITCTNHMDTHNLLPGITKITLPSSCSLASREIRIPPRNPDRQSQELSYAFMPDLDLELEMLTNEIALIHNINTTALHTDFAAFAAQANIERMDIKQVDAAIRNFKQLESIKKYSPTDISLEPADAMSTTLTIVVWAVAVLIFAVVVITLCMCCAPCATCCKGLIKAIWSTLKCISSGLQWLCRLSKRRKDAKPSARKDREQPHATWTARPSRRTSESTCATAFTTLAPDLEWHIEASPSRIEVCADLPSGKLWYNLVAGRVENENGDTLPNCQCEPSLDLRNQAMLQIAQLKPPALVEQNKRWFLKCDTRVEYDKTRKRYLSISSGREISGYRLPSF